MSSGFGWGGGRSRCFTYWQEFQKCYAQTDNPAECRPQSHDYLECLHHPGELKRAIAIQNELVRKVEHEVKESSKRSEILASGAIAAVGLIKKRGPEGSGH